MKKMTKAMLMTALILGSVQWGGTPVHASELDTFTLDEYVVTAARTETKLVDTPANITIVGAEEIESRHYTDVAEVLKDVPGANVLDTGYGTAEKAVLLNGDERVLVLVDGRRVNSDMGTGVGSAGYDFNQLPDVEFIERIEVMKGAGGALYGSDAVGGVINVITKKGNRGYGKVSVGIGSNGTEDLSTIYSFRKNKTGISVAASKYKQDYYKYKESKTGTTKRWPGDCDYQNEKVSLKIDQELSEDINLSVGYDYSEFEGVGPWKVTAPSPSAIDKKTENIYTKVDWALNGKDTGYFQYYNNKLEYYNSGDMEETTNGIDIQQKFSTSDVNTLVIGGSWRKSEVFNHNSYTKEESIDNIALFLNDTYEFAPSWILNTGVRYDNHSEAGNETTFSAGLNKKFNDSSHAYINWSEVFRAPTTDDLFYDYYGYYGNRDLKPEKGDTWTIGYTTKINDKTEFGINYFESDIDDAIDWLEDSATGNYYATNLYNQERRGIEITLNHKVSDALDLVASYTYARALNDTGSGLTRDRNYMPNVYRLGAHYHQDKWDANVWLRYGCGADVTTIDIPGDSYEWEGTTYYVPGYKDGIYNDNKYITVDMAVTYKATKDIKIFAKGYNLFNEIYAEQAGTTNGQYDFPAQSRRFLIGAEYSF